MANFGISPIISSYIAIKNLGSIKTKGDVEENFNYLENKSSKNRVRKSFTYFGITLLLIISLVVFSHFNNYTESKWVTVTVLQRTDSIGKHSSHPVLVLKEKQTGKIFDMPCSESFAYQMPVGETKDIKLRKMDWNQTLFENIVFSILYVIWFSITITVGPTLIGFGIYELVRKNE